MQTERMIWHNGQMKPESAAHVSIYDSAMMFGDTVFEMMRTFNRQTFKLTEHIDRLVASIRYLEIPCQYSPNTLRGAHESLLGWHIEHFPNVQEWRSLINVSRGILPLYQDMIHDAGLPNVMMACFPLSAILKGKSHLYTEGVRAIVPSQRAIPHHLLDARIKSRSRQHYMMANLDVARQDKDAWALLLDPYGFIAEGTGSNFFIVNGSRLATPHGRNCLRGISREYVMNMGWQVEERDITLYDVWNADEAFFTCTPYSVLPCVSVNGHPIGDGKVGAVTRDIIRRWSNQVDVDFVAQAEEWDCVSVANC